MRKECENSQDETKEMLITRTSIDISTLQHVKIVKFEPMKLASLVIVVILVIIEIIK